MTYQRLIIVDHDPGTSTLNGIRGLSTLKVLEADLVVVLRQRVLPHTGLVIQGFVTEKDRYQSANRKLSRKELISIANTAESVITVRPRGVVSEKQKK